VPTQLHEVVVEMFRVRPELARELLVTCAHVEIEDGVCEAASIDLSQALPSEYRADAVTVIRESGNVLAAIIVEVQLSADADKERTWPVYVTTLRARLRCPATLLVLAPDRVAAWARRPIEVGHPGFTLKPIIAALAAIDTLPADPGKLYFDLVMREFPLAIQRILEAFVKTRFQYRSEFAVRHRSEAVQDMVIELIRAKGASLPSDLQDRIYATNEESLHKLIGAIASATPDETLAIIERDLPPVFGDNR
jgi:hypothetical protein